MLPPSHAALPSPAISGALDFFDDRAPVPDEPLSMHVVPSVDPARQRRLQRVVTVALGVAVAIGLLALARLAVDQLQG